jgi:hypothetical protein
MKSKLISFVPVSFLLFSIIFIDSLVFAASQERDDGLMLVARYPYVASRAGWRTSIKLLHCDPGTDRTFTFVGRGESGEEIEVKEQLIRAMGSYSAYIYLQAYTSLFSEENQEKIYSIDVFSTQMDPIHLVSYVDYYTTTGSLQSSMRIDGLPLYHRLAMEWIVSGISGWYTGVNLQNYSNRVIDVYFRTQDGSFIPLIGEKFDLSQPGSSRAFLFSELVPSGPVSSGEFLAYASGSSTDSGGEQIIGDPVNALSGLTVFANTSDHGMSEGIPAFGSFIDGSHHFSHQFYYPMKSIELINDENIQQIVASKYPYYGFALQNVNDFPIKVQLRHFNPDGIELGGTFLNLRARENKGYTWNGLRDWLGVTEDTLIFKPEIGGHVRFAVFDEEDNPAFAAAMTADGEGQFAIVTGEKALTERDAASKLACFYVENRSESSLIQIVNLAEEQTRLELTLFRSSGQIVRTDQFEVPGSGLFSFNIQDLPEWQGNSGLNGILMVESSSGLIVGIQHHYSRGVAIGRARVSGKRLAPINN